MKVLFAVFLVVHGLIHLMGTAKAFGVLGGLWLLAAALLLVTAIALFTWPQWWWAVVIVLVGIALGFLSQGPWSFRAEYDREIAQCLGRAVATPLLTEADLAQVRDVSFGSAYWRIDSHRLLGGRIQAHDQRGRQVSWVDQHDH